MADSRSVPQPIHSRSQGRRQSVLSEFIPESLPYPPSFLATSPIVREILTRDIAECSSDDDSQTQVSDAESQTDGRPKDAKLAFHPNGVAYGSGYSTIAIQGLDRPVPNPREVEDSLQAEISLLRDNAILPPKHPRSQRNNVFWRLYRRLFSTKIKDHEDPEPIFQDAPAAETTPLLGGGTPEVDETLPTPPAEEIYERFEQAVAAQAIKTTWQRETKTLVQYAAPLIVTFLLHYSVTIGSVLTVGRLGMVELAAVNRECSIHASQQLPDY